MTKYLGIFVFLGLWTLGCGQGSEPGPGAGGPEPAPKPAVKAAPKTVTLTLAGYTTPREVYGKAIIPAFQKYWKEKTGVEVKVDESYLGSGAQSRAVVGGFEADVVALSLEPDVARIAEAKLITHDWKAGPLGGMVSRSIVVFAVRPGNPKGVRDWDDLGKAGLEVLTPNVKTSGGAMWNVAALFGAAMRGHTAAPAGDRAAATELLAGVLKNVKIMDKGARESMITFEKGAGDAAITYENEVLVGRKAGQAYDYVVPKSTIVIENPAAVVDVYADKHGVREVAEAFVAFLGTKESQAAYAEYGLRPVDETAAPAAMAALPKVEDPFTIRDLGDWPKAVPELFGQGGVYDQALEAATTGK